MIHTLVAKPHWSLGHYICHYSIKEFDCFAEELLLPMCANDQVNLTFYINSRIAGVKNLHGCSSASHDILKSGSDCMYCGLLTSNKGSAVFKGHVKLLSIHFKPTGLFWLFGISPARITDSFGAAYDLLSPPVIRLHEQLQEAKNNAEIFQLANNYLQATLQAHNYKQAAPCLLKVTEFLFSQHNKYSVRQLAYSANMTLKTFERKFLEQVGVYPKLYERIRRFNTALNLKKAHPKASWTMICFLSGYYDQNHFIKEFIEFTGMSPLNFYKKSPLPEEQVSLFAYEAAIQYVKVSQPAS
jgi:AraC-like DNA-binding protein